MIDGEPNMDIQVDHSTIAMGRRYCDNYLCANLNMIVRIEDVIVGQSLKMPLHQSFMGSLIAVGTGINSTKASFAMPSLRQTL
jgi:hypothetical protein